MSKDLTVGLLVDFYGQLLTEKQFTALDMYYNRDLSLAEIAENENISRQAARDFIKKGESKLREFEDKLGLVRKFTDINAEIEKIRTVVSDFPDGAKIIESLDKISDNLQ